MNYKLTNYPIENEIYSVIPLFMIQNKCSISVQNLPLKSLGT